MKKVQNLQRQKGTLQGTLQGTVHGTMYDILEICLLVDKRGQVLKEYIYNCRYDSQMDSSLPAARKRNLEYY